MTTALPICWYALIDDDGNDCRLLIFEDQLKGYKNLIKDKKILKNAANLDYKYLRGKYFGGFCMAPSESDLELFLNNLLKEEFAPQCFNLSGRRNIDPIFLAERILKERKNPIEFASEVYDANPMAQNIYRDKQKYQMLVCQHLIYNNGSTPIGLPIEELPIELIPFRIEPVYNIDELLKEVKDEMFGGIYENISYVTWTDKLYKSYYGMFYFKDNHIMINSLLNSPDVPREAVKYVIYHELLHRDYPHHDIAFRTMEHKYPNYTEWELFLNSQMTKFDIKEW
ncbi:MAG: YgjP-like metallopeptidase domain-containing protein [Acidaminococcaceae bacterium]